MRMNFILKNMFWFLFFFFEEPGCSKVLEHKFGFNKLWVFLANKLSIFFINKFFYSWKYLF